MCGRYALALRSGEVRRHLQASNMPSQEAPDDDDARQSYNFAPGYYGLVYRAEPSPGQTQDNDNQNASAEDTSDDTSQARSNHDPTQESSNDKVEAPGETLESSQPASTKPLYKLQSMKWGMIPFWSKTPPSYGGFMKTINCRDDSLATRGGMWQHVKQKKRCVVIAQGFYEWLKKNNGKEKIPHYVKRKDGQLMCFAGLWDHVRYKEGDEGKDGQEVWSYTIITTNSNKQLGFLHDRMPVILENGSETMFKWLDEGKREWTQELQSILKPFDGELECYPVDRGVGKVGNDSPSFIVPLEENKQSINNFFGNQAQKSSQEGKLDSKADDKRATLDTADAENNAPKPSSGVKHDLSQDTTDAIQNLEEPSQKRPKSDTTPSNSPIKPKEIKQTPKSSPLKGSPQKSSQGSPNANDGSMKITNFFAK